MKIGIVGYGVVGKAVHNSLPKEHLIDIYDPALEAYNYLEALFDCDAVFICVPTPNKKGKQDMSYIEDTFKVFSDYNEIEFIIKSTILPNNIDALIKKYPELSIVYAPEFLDQNKPYFEQVKHIIGIDNIFQANLYKEIFSNNNVDDFRTTNHKTAAMIKYVHNTYGALKVTFFNEIKDICDKDNVDYREMVGGLLQATEHIGRCYTRMAVDGQRGFGGTCFPKDSAAFVNEYNIETLKAAVNKNFKYREKEMKGVTNASKTFSNCSCKNGK